MHSEEISSTQRVMPWRVELALNRLLKDLKSIPLYHQADTNAIAEAKGKIISDIVRPLRQAGVLKDLVLYSDLATAYLDSDLGWDLDYEIIHHFPGALIVPICWEIIEDFRRERSRPPENRNRLSYEWEARYETVLRKAGERLIAEKSDEASEESYRLLEALLGFGLVRRDDLPEKLRDKIRIGDLVDEYLKYEDGFLEMIDRDPSDEDFVLLMHDLPTMFEILLERKAFLHALRVIKVLNDFAEDRRDKKKVFRGGMASEAVKHLAASGTVMTVIRDFAEFKREDRESLSKIFIAMGKDMVLPLLDAILLEDRPGPRRELGQILSAIGRDAGGVVLEALSRQGLPDAILRDLIVILGDIRYEPAVVKIPYFLRSKDSRMREEAVSALFKINDPHSGQLIAEALDDEDEHVRHKAVACLGSLRSTTPRFLSFLLETVRVKTLKEREASEDLQVRALDAIRKIGNVRIREGVPMERILADGLGYRGLSNMVKVLKLEQHRSKVGRIKALICEVLGDIGTASIVPYLEEALKDPEADIARRAAEALRKIIARQQSPS